MGGHAGRTSTAKGIARAVTLGVLVGATALVAAGLGPAASAQAHNYLVASTPAAGSTMTELPEQFSITTNEALLDISGDGTGFALQVTDAGGLFYGDGCVTVEGASVSTPAALGKGGTYLVQWQIISADGHPISDEFSFDWQPAESATPSVGSVLAPNCGRAPVDNPSVSDSASLSNVLWVGGILAAIVVAVLVTLGLLTRRPKV